MDVQVITPATLMSIDVDLVKANKRILHSKEDSLIEGWIRAADEFIAGATNRSLMKQTLRLTLSKVLPVIQLPYPPLIAAPTTFKYTVKGGTEVIVTPGTDTAVTIVSMLPTFSILDLTRAYDGTMTIEYDAGYDDQTKVPPLLKQAVLLLATHYASSREAAYLDPKAILIERKIVYGVDDIIRKFWIPNTNEPINGGY